MNCFFFPIPISLSWVMYYGRIQFWSTRHFKIWKKFHSRIINYNYADHIIFNQNTHPYIRVCLSWGDPECCWWGEGGRIFMSSSFLSKQLRGKKQQINLMFACCLSVVLLQNYFDANFNELRLKCFYSCRFCL